MKFKKFRCYLFHGYAGDNIEITHYFFSQYSKDEVLEDILQDTYRFIPFKYTEILWVDPKDYHVEHDIDPNHIAIPKKTKKYWMRQGIVQTVN